MARVASTLYVYNGQNLIGVTDQSGSILSFSVWASKQPGAPNGPGRLDALLANCFEGAGETNCWLGYDASGNVTSLFDAAGGGVLASYDYGPFGEPTRSTGIMSKVNCIRYKAQYSDVESGFVNFLARYYDPLAGRWLSRDPAEDLGMINLYNFVGNDPINYSDSLGLIKYAFYGGRVEIDVKPSGGSGTYNFSTEKFIPVPRVGSLLWVSANLSITVEVKPTDKSQSLCVTPTGSATTEQSTKYGFLYIQTITHMYNPHLSLQEVEEDRLSSYYYRASSTTTGSGFEYVWIPIYCQCYRANEQVQGKFEGEANLLPAAVVPILTERAALRELLELLYKIWLKAKSDIPLAQPAM